MKKIPNSPHKSSLISRIEQLRDLYHLSEDEAERQRIAAELFPLACTYALRRKWASLNDFGNIELRLDTSLADALFTKTLRLEGPFSHYLQKTISNSMRSAYREQSQLRRVLLDDPNCQESSDAFEKLATSFEQEAIAQMDFDRLCETLSVRELEVLNLRWLGHTEASISEILNIRPGTVSAYVARIAKKAQKFFPAPKGRGNRRRKKT